MPGPPPKPTVLKKLAGNPGHKPLPENEPQPRVPDRAPMVPRWLSNRAKDEWRRVVKDLMEVGLYTNLDYMMLALMCESFARYVNALEEMKKSGGEILKSKETGNLYQNPWSFVVNKAWDQLVRVGQQFGLSPSARTRIQVEQPDKEPTLAELLFSGE